MTTDGNRIEITNGGKRAVFTKTEKGWAPDWFYEGDRRMLRFKDHEWLSIGHDHPAFAAGAEKIRGGYVFRGEMLYGKTPVTWEVRVATDKQIGGFVVEASFTPARTIELMEAFSSFETPYEYDGTEVVTTVIGQNPITRWKGKERVSPEQWMHPFWTYNRPECVHMTGMCNAPLLCQEVKNADGGNARHTTIIGDWNVCKAHDIFMTPTRTVDNAAGDWGENKKAQLRGYKFIVGCVNWSSSMAQDPNVLYKAGTRQRQRVFVTFSGSVPGGSFDQQLLAAWQRAAACDMPADGQVLACDVATQRGVSWPVAVKWLRDVFCADHATEGLFHPERGIRTYAAGTRPKAGDDCSWQWWPQWAGLLHYQALVKGDAELARRCETFDGKFAARMKEQSYDMIHAPIVGITAVPSLWWTSGAGRNGTLAQAMRPALESAWKQSVAENGTARKADYGNQAARAECFLLAGEAYGEAKYAEQALILVEEIDARLDGNFWEFGCTTWADKLHGGQVRPVGYGHAISVNLLAWRRTKKDEYLEAARRFARLLVSVNYMTHNDSPVEDMDYRGWANGTTGGRDQHAEMPPWETSNALLCMTALMAEQELEAGCFDVVWYFARTGLCQFPAARSLKRIWDPTMQKILRVPRSEIASEQDFYDVLPYLAYENPHDQTLLASYQGTDCLLGELVYGGGLACVADPRVTAVVPRAATLDARELDERQVVLWNPLSKSIETKVAALWAGGGTTEQAVTVESRKAQRLVLRRNA